MTLLTGSAKFLLVGLATTVAAPLIIPVLGTVGRPLAKGAIKGALLLSGRTKRLVTDVGEQWRELVTEVRTENGKRALFPPDAEAGSTH